MVCYSMFVLFLDFGPIKVWDNDSIGIYRILDVLLAFFSLLTCLFFWFYPNASSSLLNIVIKTVLFFILLWAGVITGIELTTLGFSTLIVVVLISVFFIYNNFLSSIFFFSGAFIAFVCTVLIRGNANDSFIPALVILIPTITISCLISKKNYLSKVNELISTDKLNVLNQELSEMKDNLEKLVEDRTRELNIAKEKAEESDRLKSAFLANMSHEIRTPMNGILGFAGLLKEPNLDSDEQSNYITMIEEGGERMLNIINNLIDISKLESGMMKVDISETNINTQLDYVYSFFKPEVEDKGMQLILNNCLKEKDASIFTDREKVYAILTNLIKNAIKYSDHGYIEIGCSLVKPSAEPFKEKTELQFYVKDTGIGISQDRHKAVFERFIQADIANKRAYQGAGLGLSISKGYAELLGGRIWMESEPGKGSIFHLSLPHIINT